MISETKKTDYGNISQLGPYGTIAASYNVIKNYVKNDKQNQVIPIGLKRKYKVTWYGILSSLATVTGLNLGFIFQVKSFISRKNFFKRVIGIASLIGIGFFASHIYYLQYIRKYVIPKDLIMQKINERMTELSLLAEQAERKRQQFKQNLWKSKQQNVTGGSEKIVEKFNDFKSKIDQKINDFKK